MVYMIFACGISNYSVSMFHLIHHVCFKALLFSSAGSVINALNDEQDMRRMGGASPTMNSSHDCGRHATVRSYVWSFSF